MTLSPGDTIQIILTVGGVPFAKTWGVRSQSSDSTIHFLSASLLAELINDVDLYANETECGHQWECAHDESKLICVRCGATKKLISDEKEST